MAASLTAKVDTRGRVLIPTRVRERLGIEPGDTLFIEYDVETRTLRCAKAENPFVVLAEHVIAEYRAGRTRNVREFAAENSVALDDD
jgi:AbrB family looped-hinge helix DNA binding protein